MNISPQGRLYKWTPHGIEAAYPEFPDRFSVLLLPSLQNMSADELRHLVAIVDEGRAKSVVYIDGEE